jgi:hypothetical protein
MSIDGNLQSGQTVSLATPKILVNGSEVTGGTRKVDSRLVEYNYKNLNDGKGFAVDAPAELSFTSDDDDVEFFYTLTGRNPVSGDGAGDLSNSDQKQKSGKYDDDNKPSLTQNTTGDGTVVKVRAFNKDNSNIVSKVVRLDLNVLGGNTVG